jgi:protein-disulfide isomerase
MLSSHGFTKVRRYAGGIRDWLEAGYSFERDSSLEAGLVEMTSLSQPVAEEDHVQGDIDAPVRLVVYGDYACPYTRRTMTHMRGLQRRLGDELCFVYRHFPAPQEIHPPARTAAEAALAANNQGKFWEMHDHLFRHQKALAYEYLADYAAELGLDVTQFERELAERTHLARIQRNLESGHKSGAQAVPTLFINEARYDGNLKLAAILRVIEEVKHS